MKTAMRVVLMAVAAGAAPLAATADRVDPLAGEPEGERLALWPAGCVPDMQANQYNHPFIEWFAPSNRTTDAVLIMTCGGGYAICNWRPRGEVGGGLRDFFLAKGMTVVRLHHRTPRPVTVPKHLTAWQDAQRAVRLVRAGARAHGVNPENIGFLGYSAAGHLAVLASVSSSTRTYARIDATDDLPCHVNWAVPLYPAYVLKADGSFEGEFAFDGKTAPLCLMHGGADPITPLATVRVYERLHAMKIPCEMHVLALRAHDFMCGARPGTPSATWRDRVWEWLVQMEIVGTRRCSASRIPCSGSSRSASTSSPAQGCVNAPEAHDVTDRMETLGSPLSARYPDAFRDGTGAYARNVWTMCAYDGRVYLGCGNSSNGGPATGCGPVPIVAYDPKQGAFREEGQLPDEQIDVFKVLSDGALYVPGHDPTERWELGNVYRRRPGAGAAWEKLRTLPWGLHCYDLDEFDGRLIACGYGTYESRDRGATFDWAQEVRYYAFLKFPETLYAVATVSEPQLAEKRKVNRFESFLWDIPGETVVARRKAGGAFARVASARPADVFPDTPEVAAELMKPGRASAVGRRLVYLGGIVHNDHQMAPVGAYVAEDGPAMFKARRIRLPPGATPWQTLSEGGKVYLLYAVRAGDGRTFTNHVAVSADGASYAEVLRFRAPTFARAFAYLDGYFYFGLGTEVKDHGRYVGNNALQVDFAKSELAAASGTILRCPHRL